jgi:hypothetical protein
MRAFDVSPAIEPLREVYPSADAIITAVRGGDRDARYAIARLWLSEGIPYSFKALPGLYESLRRWLALRLEVQAKEITIIGSGRQGFCLSPGKDLGRPFGDHSDLDLTIVSPRLFRILAAAFERWNKEYMAGAVSPRNDKERKRWDQNTESVPSGLIRGFIDPHKIPTWNRYPEAQMIAQAKYVAHEKLKVTPAAPAVRELSIRVYRDWDSFIRQMAINLESVALSSVNIKSMPNAY